MNAEARRRAISHEHKFSGLVDAVMNRPPGQLGRLAVRGEFAVTTDPKCCEVMLVAGKSRPARAGRHIEELSGRARPRVLDATRHFDRTASRQRIGADVDVVM